MSQPSKFEAARTKQFEESRFDPYKQRHGLFSIPGNLAIGDDVYARELASKKGPDGKIITAPRNFLTIIPKSGQVKEGYFSTPEYVCGTYQDPPPKYLKERDNAEKMMNCHGKPWKSNGTFKEPLAMFEYTSVQADQRPNRRGPDGKISLGPKGFFTSPPKRGAGSATPGTTIGKYPEYISSPYDSQEEWLREQRRKEKSLRLDAPFRPSSCNGRNFTDSKTLYDYSHTLASAGKKTTYDGIKHEKPFMPFSSTLPGNTIGKFPEHVADPYPEREKIAGKNDNLIWKSNNYKLKTWVSPPLSSYARNVKSALAV